jgi:hypothetical protein
MTGITTASAGGGLYCTELRQPECCYHVPVAAPILNFQMPTGKDFNPKLRYWEVYIRVFDSDVARLGETTPPLHWQLPHRNYIFDTIFHRPKKKPLSWLTLSTFVFRFSVICE